ncbi:MAG TPA: CopD family protein, partial [Ilumatobacteraceae bacterium]
KAIMAAALALGLVEMVLRNVPAAVPVNKPRTTFGDVFTFVHIASGGVWIGGLVGLAALAIGRAVPNGVRAAFWPGAIRRFSLTAMSCVGLTVLSGMWLAWVHIGAISQLGTTLYGRTVLLKVCMVAALVALGGFNHLWLRPRLEAMRAAGDERSIVSIVGHHFRSVVAAEVVLGACVLFVVPYLSGSARNQDFQKKAADISQTAAITGGHVTFTPSGLQPGLTDYDVSVSGSTPQAITLSFASADLGAPAQTVVAKSVGAGHFRAEGLYTPIVGTWDVGVAIDQAPVVAHFADTVTAKAAKLPKSLPPRITAQTWLAGTAIVLVVIGALAAAAGTGRRRTRKLVRASTAGLDDELEALGDDARPDLPADVTA